MVERLLEIRHEFGFPATIFLRSSADLATCLDAYGFDVYSLNATEVEFHFGKYRAPCAPGGGYAHNLLKSQ